MYKGVNTTIAHHLHYYKHLHKRLEKHKGNVENNKMMNYINEYDRIRGQLSKTHIGSSMPESKEHLKKRKQDLEKIVKHNFKIT
jgi:DNA repair photolyase